MKEQPSVREMVQIIRRELSDVTTPEEAYQFAWLLWQHLRGYSKTAMVLHGETKITHLEHLFVQKALERLKNHEPIQYVLGKTEFYGLPFLVNPSVLIPRPETEELVEWILKEPVQPGMSLLDMGTGSGCIAIALKKNWAPAKVTGWDFSGKALDTARQNAKLNGVSVHFEKQDILDVESKSGRLFNIIVSNPPYVRVSERHQMNKNVLEHEPSTALFVPDEDPLLFYRAIARFAAQAMLTGGLLFFEINQAFGPQLVELLQASGFEDVVLRADLSGRSRMVRGRRV